MDRVIASGGYSGRLCMKLWSMVGGNGSRDLHASGTRRWQRLDFYSGNSVSALEMKGIAMRKSWVIIGLSCMGLLAAFAASAQVGASSAAKEAAPQAADDHAKRHQAAATAASDSAA